MKKEIRQYQFEIRGMSDEGIVEGIGSATEVYIECYNEVVSRGAFKKTIQETGGKVSFFRNHNPDIELGTTLDMWEEKAGLGFKAEMLINDIPEARSEWALMKQKFDLGIKRGVSMGFMAIKEGIRKQFAGFSNVRDLIEVRVFELSPTPFPANTKAGLTQLRNELGINHSDLMQVVNLLNKRGYNIDFDKLITEVSLPEKEAENTEPDILHSINEALKRSINTIKTGV